MSLKDIIERPVLLDLLRYKKETYQNIENSDLDHQDLRKFLCRTNIAARTIYRVGCGYGGIIAGIIGAKYNPDYSLECGLAAAGVFVMTFTLDELVLKKFADPFQDLSKLKR